MNRNKIPAFNDTYFTGEVVYDVYKIKVNDKLPKLTAEEVAQEYKRFGITQLNKDYFQKNANLTTLEKNKMITEYEHRDALIATGQYRKYRDEIFHKNYINALIKNNADKAYVNFFKKLTDEQFVKLAYIPKVTKEDEDKFLIPMPKMYYQDKIIVRNINDDESVDIENAIDIAGLRDVMKDVLESLEDEKEKMNQRIHSPRARAINLAIERAKQTRIDKPQMTARVIGTIPRSIRESINFPTYTTGVTEHEIRYRIYAQLEAKGKLYNKYGNINFVSNDEKRGYQYWKQNK